VLRRCNTARDVLLVLREVLRMRVGKPSKSQFARYLVTAIAVIAVAGCASLPDLTAPPFTSDSMQKRAIERSTERWKALTDKRFTASFDYLSEASKQGITVGEYASAMQRMGYVAATVESATCDEQGTCVVKTKVTLPIFVRNVGARLQTLPVEERWIANNRELWLIRQ
jgi:hypothetical protein